MLISPEWSSSSSASAPPTVTRVRSRASQGARDRNGRQGGTTRVPCGQPRTFALIHTDVHGRRDTGASRHRLLAQANQGPLKKLKAVTKSLGSLASPASHSQPASHSRPAHHAFAYRPASQPLPEWLGRLLLFSSGPARQPWAHGNFLAGRCVLTVAGRRFNALWLI